MLVDVTFEQPKRWISTIVHERASEKLVLAKFGSGGTFWGLSVDRTPAGGFRGANGSGLQIRKTEIERVKKDRRL